jgi:hypothetical protein
MRSITSWRDAEEWLEGLRSSGASGGGGSAQIQTQTSVKSCQRNAPECGEDRETKKRRQDHLDASELTINAGSDAELRQAIRAGWRRLGYWNKRGKGEGSEGFL